MKKVIFSYAAEADLDEIADYISADNSARALSFIRELRESCSRLAAFPLSCPLVPRYEATGIRRMVHGRYLIFYRVGKDRTEIIHVLNGAMDYEPILFPSPGNEA